MSSVFDDIIAEGYKVVILGSGDKEYEDFFAVLKEGGYDGRVSIEAYSENKEKEISGAVFIRKYF